MAQGYLAVIVSMLIWGSVGIFARKAGTDALVSVTYRVLFSALAMSAVMLFQRGRTEAKPATAGGQKRWGLLVFSGIALATNWFFFFKAVQATTVANAVLSYYTAPVMVAIASPFLVKERFEGRTLLAAGLAFAGVVVMTFPFGQASLKPADLLGIVYGLIAAAFYALVTLSARWLAHIPAARLVWIQSLVAAPVMVGALLATAGAGALAVSGTALALLAVMGTVHTALALFLYFYGLKHVRVQHAGVLAYLDPFSSLVFAALFLGEPLTGQELVGGALVLGASALLLRSGGRSGAQTRQGRAGAGPQGER